MKLWGIIVGLATIFLGYALNSAIIDLLGIIILLYGIIKKEKKENGH